MCRENVLDREAITDDLFYMFAIDAFPLGSIEAMRPVFWIVMGISLVLFAWRLARTSAGWDGWLMMFGALMLGFGYVLVLPLYHAGIIQTVGAANHLQTNADIAMAWQAVRIFAMNGGWLLFGLGLAWHAKTMSLRKKSPLEIPPQTHPADAPRTSPNHHPAPRKSVA